MNARVNKVLMLQILLSTATIGALFILLYFIPRNNFIATYGLIVFLFILYFLIVRKFEYAFPLKIAFGLAILLRIIALFNVPILSDDYFRFIWDGQMSIRHINPFSYTPEVFIKTHPELFLQYLVDKMNSAEYYTVYPPVLQYFFWTAAKLFPTNEYAAMIMLKIPIFLSECLTGYFLIQYCKFKQIDTKNVLWYMLNPLVIIELTGNVHYEAVLILFLVLVLYFLEKNNLLASGIFWGLSICTKFLPLMLAPLFLNYLRLGRFFKFGIIALLTSLLLFYPFIDRTLLNIKDSLGKFYDLFEFNASIYYLLKWVGGFFTSNDISDFTAKILGLISFLIILAISIIQFKKEKLVQKCLFIFSIYFLMTTMIHPWYITTLVAFASLTNFRYPIMFSLLIPLSYFPYSLINFEENLFVILFEYLILFIFIFIEFKFNKKLQYNLKYK